MMQFFFFFLVSVVSLLGIIVLFKKTEILLVRDRNQEGSIQAVIFCSMVFLVFF